MARTQIKLNQLIQDGATSNQVISWNGSNWAPSTITGDGNGIYSASGTIHTGAVATVALGSSFTIDFNGSNPAIIVADTLGTVDIVDKTGLYGFTTGSAASSLFGDGGDILIDSNTIKLRSTGYIQIGGYATPTPMRFYEGSGSGTHYTSFIAPASLAANLEYVLPTSATDGRYLKYNSAGNQLEWATITGDGNGIYSGAGTVPTNTVATITDTLTFRETVAANTGVITPVTIDVRTSNGSGGAASFGAGLLFTAETTTTESREIFGIESSWVTASDITRTAAVAFRLASGGTYATRLTLNPTSLVPAAAFTIGGSSDTTIGGSTGRAVLQSSGNAADAILLNVNGLTNSSGITLIGANTFTNGTGTKVGVTVNGSFVPTTGSATWTSMAITPTINQFTGGTGITRGLHINPSLNTPADFRALEIGNTLANTYAIHQSGTSVLNMLGGNTGIGTAPGSEKLRVSGTIRFDLGSDVQGDIYYRNSTGNFTRLGIGTNGHVLTSNGTIPTWAAPAAGGNGIYGGSGTIASAAVATVTSGSTFTIDYNGGVDAILVDDTNGNVTINAKGASTGTLQVNDTGVALGGAAVNGIVYVDDASFALTNADSYTPATSQNNYAIADGTSIVRLTPSANINITGISQTTSTNGRLLIIHNTSSANTITLKNESASSSAANRLALGVGEVYDVVIRPLQSYALIYDGTSSRWRSVVSDRNESTPQSINAQTGTSYTLVISDAGKLITLDNGAAITLTVPTNASVAFPIGTHIDLAQLGAGQVTIGGSGVTFRAKNGQKLSGQYAGASIVKIATDTWLCVGDLTT